MTFARYFKSSSYCLIGAGVLALVSTGSVGPVSIILFAAVFICSWFLDTVSLRQRIPTWVLNCAALAYLFFFAFDGRHLSYSFILAVIHLLLFISALKLLTASKDRDYVQLYLISFTEVIAASTLTVNIAYGFCLVLFLFCGINTMVLFEMRRSNAKMQGSVKVQLLVGRGESPSNGLQLFSPFPARLFFVTTTGITLLIIIAAIPLFFLLPRVNVGLYGRPSGDTQLISGFSDRVELGQLGTIKQSDAVVMRIRTNKPPSEMPVDLKWRGIAFDSFDGRSWRRTSLRQFQIPTQGWYYKLEDSTQGTNWLQQTVFMEALSANVVFAAHKVLAVSQDVGSLHRDANESLYTGAHTQKKLRYSAISDRIRPNPENMSDLLPIPPEILRTYLQLPPEDPRIADLAKRATKAAPNKYAKAQALEEYLRSNYRYSLELRGTPNSKDPLAMFLFDVRAGHCEYFASSMAVMLRQLGIPSRLVNGFRAGEYNNIGDSWTVRQYHAHSWVEAYVPPYGWTEFDPTPTDPEHSQNNFARLFSNLTDAIDLWWWEGVVNYDSSQQYRVISAVYSIFEKFRSGADSLWKRASKTGRMTASLLRSPAMVPALIQSSFLWVPCLAIVVLLMIRPLRRRILNGIRRALHQDNPRMVATSFYAEALALLEDRGFKLGPGQTPLEFARSLGGHPSGGPLLALTQMYNSIRFGSLDLPFNQAEAQTQLRQLRNSLRKQ
jgi:protein-glutamine gamma-glutamyltransferase